MWETANILKISKLSFENHLYQLGYVNHFDVWVPDNLFEKYFLDHISTCDSLLKCNENLLFLKRIMMGNEKWILYNNVDGRDCGASEMNHQQPYQSPVFIQRRGCCIYVGIGRELLLEKSSNDFQQVLLSDRLKAALSEKHPELVNRKHIISIRIRQDHTFLWWSGKNCYILTSKFWFICCICQALHLWMSIYFSLYKIIWKIFLSLYWIFYNIVSVLYCFGFFLVMRHVGFWLLSQGSNLKPLHWKAKS